MFAPTFPGYTAQYSLATRATHQRSPVSGPIPSCDPSIVPAQGLDPQKLTCAALCAICAGTLVAPELILPEIACAMCVRMCSGGAG